MGVVSLNAEFAAISSSTRRFVGVSTALHVLLFLWLAFYKTVAPPAYGLVEIAWVEPAAAAVAEEAAPPVAREVTPEAPVQEAAEQDEERVDTRRFERELTRAEVAPQPQSRTVDEVLSRRLESMQRDTRRSQTSMAALVPPPSVGVPALAGAPAQKTSPSTPSELARSSAPSRPVELTRMDPAGSASSMPTVSVPEPSAARASVDAPHTDAARDLAGARLVGPVADRGLVSSATPDYPEWAKREGVEATVTLYFFVLPNGRVKENILVEKTSGFQDFDQSARTALSRWRFEPLGGGARDQWGRITFHFRLSGNL